MSKFGQGFQVRAGCPSLCRVSEVMAGCPSLGRVSKLGQGIQVRAGCPSLGMLSYKAQSHESDQILVLHNDIRDRI